MKKFAATLLSLIACICMCLAFVACSNSNDDNTPTPTPTPEPKPIPVPTAAEIIDARDEAAEKAVQGYDFDLTFKGDFSVLGLGTSLSGNYDGSYRYNKDTDEVTFKRTTSGALLADSTCYVFTQGDSRIKATMDGSSVKKLSVDTPEEQNITMINLPFASIVNSIEENNISNVTAKQNSKFTYSCQLSVENSNPAYTLLSKVFEKLGTGVSFKGIDFAGEASTLDFNLKDGKLDDFHLGFEMQISVKAVTVVLSIDYTQNESQSSISLPNIQNAGFIYAEDEVQTEINAINTAIQDLKNDPVYSLDLLAKNELDPGWNKTAVVDSYTARMLKTTIDGTAWFNHSYFYKAHSETDGKETYKYTLGNVNGTDEENRGTWLISRKSSNAQTQVQNVTADTQFDFCTSVVQQQASEIDCVKKQIEGTTTTYTLYLGKMATQSLQRKIIDMINTNPYDEVIEVNNYFNSDHVIKDADIKITLVDGKISSIVCETELCYTPTGGEYTEYNVTLNNSIELKVNENLEKAQEYVPPTKVKGTMGFGKNLNDSEYYIL